MRLFDIIWNERFAAKIAEKHGIITDEVEEILFSKPHVRLAEKGLVKGEHLYAAYGRIGAGRYLIDVLYSQASRGGPAHLGTRNDEP